MKKVLDDILLSENVTDNFHKQYSTNAQFRDWILKVIPEVEACRKQRQDNPWHIYNCLDHILHSVEQINKQTQNLDPKTQRKLAYTMFLHDIGKPQKHLRRYSKLYKREVDSFFNHNLASADVVDRVIQQHFGFDQKEAKEIHTLVEKHDIFMFITLENDGNQHHKVLTAGYLQDEISDLNKTGNGAELMRQLIMVGRADNGAQNPEMTEQSFKLLNKMDSMLTNLTQTNAQDTPVQ